MVYFLFKYMYKGPCLLDAVDSAKSHDLRYITTTLCTSYVINGYAIGTTIRQIKEPCGLWSMALRVAPLRELVITKSLCRDPRSEEFYEESNKDHFTSSLTVRHNIYVV
ncbi:unnamed protein product [Brassica oleracea]